MNFGFGPHRNEEDGVDEYGGQDLMNRTQELSQLAKRNMIMNKTMSVMGNRKRDGTTKASVAKERT